MELKADVDAIGINLARILIHSICIWRNIELTITLQEK